jgi:hypothetical protein
VGTVSPALIAQAAGDLRQVLKAMLTGLADRIIEAPPRAAALLNKDRLTREQLEFAIRRASQEPR